MERLPHVKGELAKHRELIRLEPWQCFALVAPFGWLRRDGTRRFRRVYLEVARKNAKSTLSSAVGLYALAGDDEEGAEVYALATTKDQAGIVWNDAAAMARRSPGLCRRFGLEVGAAAITRTATNAMFRPLPGDPGDGTNPHFAIVDEYHEHQTQTAYEAMASGMGARMQPMMWTVTTAGYNRKGPCYQLREYADKVLRGVVKDDYLFALVYTLDATDDWTNPKAWVKANPNIGVSVSYDSLVEACHEAQHSPTKQTAVKTKRLNLWVNAGNAWMNMLEWDRNADPTLLLDSFNGRRAWLALDLASKVDIAALEILIEDAPGKLVRFGRYYLPHDRVEAEAHSTLAHFAGWALDGWVTLTSGNVIDFSVIKATVVELCSRLDVQAVAFDPFQATQFAAELQAQGVPMVEVRQIVANMSEPMKQVEADTRAGVLRHDGDPVMAWMMGNVIARTDEKDNIYPRKAVSQNKIDGPVALIMARGRAMVPTEEIPTPYIVVL